MINYYPFFIEIKKIYFTYLIYIFQKFFIDIDTSFI